jgi:Flp pilus assembly CpaE family ATPase
MAASDDGLHPAAEGLFFSADGSPPLGVIVGLGDPARERVLLPELRTSGDVSIVARCLTADQVIERAQGSDAVVALIAFDLHRLGSDTLAALIQTRIALVVLAPDPTSLPWPTGDGFPGLILPLDADPQAIRSALQAAVQGERSASFALRHRAVGERSVPESARISTGPGGTMLCAASGPGSPGRTTVALNLALALGAVAPTILVDADLVGPSVAAHLDLNPARNLAMLAHADPTTPVAWERALAEDVQPLSPRSPQGFVLCGLPKLELRTTISRGFFERLIAQLRPRYRYVLCDLGADLLGGDLPVHRTALGLADQILLVTAADLVELWRGRAGRDLLRDHLHVAPERTALVINRHQARHHNGRVEIEASFGTAAAAVIPDDPVAAQRALADQRPLVLDARSRAGRALIDLAERICAGRITLPPEASDRRRTWPAWANPYQWVRPKRHAAVRTEEVRTA